MILAFKLPVWPLVLTSLLLLRKFDVFMEIYDHLVIALCFLLKRELKHSCIGCTLVIIEGNATLRTSDFIAKHAQSGRLTDEPQLFFYSPAKWSLAGRFLLPPEPNMLSSESIIYKPDTSSASTPANYSATVCCHRAPQAAAHANCMRANVNGLVYCWGLPPPQVKTSFNSGLSDRVNKGVFRVSGRSV